MNIPKIIHQIWVGKTGTSVQPPERYGPYTDSLRKMNPDFKYRMWLDDDINSLIQKDYAEFWKIYNQLPYPIMKADMARWIVLHKYGGVYSDLDFIGLKPLSGLWEKYPDNDIILVCEPKHILSGNNKCNNGFIQSIPQHPAVLGVVKTIAARCGARGFAKGHVDVINTTGPGAVFDSMSQWTDFQTKWVIQRNLILPRLEVYDDGGDMSEAYVHTEWEAGTNWASEFIPDMIGMPVMTYLWVVLISVVAILLIILVTGWMSSWNRNRYGSDPVYNAPGKVVL